MREPVHSHSQMRADVFGIIRRLSRSFASNKVLINLLLSQWQDAYPLISNKGQVWLGNKERSLPNSAEFGNLKETKEGA